jgi:predicted RNA polymerase sigma factor
LNPTPVVAMNRAIAVEEVAGPQAALELGRHIGDPPGGNWSHRRSALDCLGWSRQVKRGNSSMAILVAASATE